jgi:hypothetical protein
MRKNRIKSNPVGVRILSALGLVAVFLAATVPGVSQEVTASITGVITDPSGAAVVGTKVVAKDLDRGTVYPATSNEDGAYTLTRIPVGRYEVRATSSGFQASVQPNVVLQLNQIAKIDFQMKLGDVNQTIEVTTAAPILQTDSTQLGTIIDAHENEALPLATRNYVQLTLLSAGSVHPDPSSFKNGQTTASSGRPYINGNREQANNFLLDGMDNNQVSDNLVGYAPSVDAIQEFNLITQNASAEFGNFMGGIVSTSIKSGTNQFHGSAFEFFRNDVLNANEWSSNFTGSDRAKLRWNNFGGTFGGPVKRDKLFFFVDYQGSRFSHPASASTISVFTAAERRGDFSQLLTRDKPVQLYNPFSLDANGNRVPFAGNIIPATYFSRAASNILNSQYYPLPVNANLQNNLFNTNRSAINGDQGDAKVDYNLSEKDRLFVRYSQSQIDNPTTNSLPLIYNSFATYPTYNGVINWTRTITPSLVNELRLGVNYVRVNNGASDNGIGNLNETFGIPGVPNTILAGMVFNGGFVQGLNQSTTAIGNSNNYQLFADTVIQYVDNVILTRGAHTMHFGFQGQRQRLNTFYSGNNGLAGTFNFDGRYTAGPLTSATSGAGSGIAEADFLLGLPSTIGSGVNGGTWGQRAWIFSGYFQDDWRLTSNLTLNLGLRYQLHTPWVEVKNRQANFGLISGQLLLAGQNGASEALYNQYNGITNWQPRIGVAWSPTRNTVVRAAYTLSTYLEGTGTNLRLTINPPFAAEHNANYTTLTTGLPGSTLDQGFVPLQASDPFAGATLRLWDPNVRPAVANQWNFTVQRQLGSNTTLQVGYAGQKTTHLMVPMPYLQSSLNANGTVTPSVYLSGNPTLQKQIGQISGTASNGNQSYNALQVTLQKRLSEGLQYQVAYTYSKCLTDSSGYYGSWGGQTTPTSPYWQNLYDKKAEWGPCYYDSTHVLTSYVTYDLPVGRNRKFGKNMNRAVDAVIGGWQVNAIVSFHGGFPLTISASDASLTQSRGARANCIAPADVFNTRQYSGGGYQWFDPASYAQPQSGFGSCGVGTVRGPGLNTADLSLVKNFSITERHNIELRGEAINFTNTPILNSPNAGFGTTLGVLQSSQGARNVQFALKYRF